MPPPLIDETGNIYGSLTVIKPIREPNMRKTMWLCKCSCGAEKIFNGSELRSGKRTSCGRRCNNIEDETDKVYGFLKVLSKDLTPAINFPDKSIHWICQCLLCGNIKSISGRMLRNGDAQSCGCSKSLGEQYITKILINKNVNFIKEYSFEDLKGEYKPLRFDFCIKDNNKILYLIEFQGTQHLNQNHFLGGKIEFEQRQEYDKKKEEYCNNNHIKLLKIYAPKQGLQTIDGEKEIISILEKFEKEIKGDTNECIFNYYL